MYISIKRNFSRGYFQSFKQISKWHFKNPNALLLNKTILITMNAGDHSKAKKEANKLNKIGTYHECKCKWEFCIFVLFVPSTPLLPPFSSWEERRRASISNWFPALLLIHLMRLFEDRPLQELLFALHAISAWHDSSSLSSTMKRNKQKRTQTL